MTMTRVYCVLRGVWGLATAVFKETLRLYPPAPLTARHTTKDLKLDDIDVPAGTSTWLPIWFIHRSEFNFDNPLAFEPERFLDDRASRSTKNFFSFSAGTRQHDNPITPEHA